MVVVATFSINRGIKKYILNGILIATGAGDNGDDDYDDDGDDGDGYGDGD